MAVEERRRAGLFDALAGALGEEAANTVFELLPPAGHDGATSDDVERLGIALRTDMEALRIELREEMAELRTDLRGEMAELRTDLREEMTEFRAGLREEMTELRAELHTEMGELRTELRTEMALLRGDMTSQHAELLATFRHELNEALLRSNRSMVIGLASTLLAAITLAAVLARFVT